MNAALVDHLVCPRCGPPFGLLLLAHDVRRRRVLRGEFGCANCRDRFPVVDGFADLRPPPRRAVPDGRGGLARRRGGGSVEAGGGGEVPWGVGGGAEGAGPGAGSAAGALRLAAALGVGRGPGLVVVPDACRDEAPGLAGLVRDIEVVVVGWGGRGLVAGRDGVAFAGVGAEAEPGGGAAGGSVSAFATGPTLPLRDGVARGVAAAGDAGPGWWDECLRVLTPGGRVVIVGATDAAREWARGAGLVAVLDELAAGGGADAEGPGGQAGGAGAEAPGGQAEVSSAEGAGHSGHGRGVVVGPSGWPFLVAALPPPGAAPRLGKWRGPRPAGP